MYTILTTCILTPESALVFPDASTNGRRVVKIDTRLNRRLWNVLLRHIRRSLLFGSIYWEVLLMGES